MDAMTPLLPRASTGVSGLDEILGGGLARDRLHLLEGSPGTGKTTIALQFLLAGAEAGEAGIYVSLAETEHELRDGARSHGWTIGPKIEIFELVPPESVLDPDQHQSLLYSSDLELGETVQRIFDCIERIKPKRIVIDSLSEIRLLAQSSLRYRRQILALKHYFAQHNSTVIMLDDLTTESTDRAVHSIAHSVIHLDQLAPIYGGERRRLRIVKCRGQSFRGGYHDFNIEPGGVAVFPRLVAADHRSGFSGKILHSGIAGLDQLLGGGAAAGSSTLIIGPAGTGKSLLSLHYLAAAVGRGERGALFVFDEELGLLFARAKGLGIDLEAMRAEKKLSSSRWTPPSLRPANFHIAFVAAWTAGMSVSSSSIALTAIRPRCRKNNTCDQETDRIARGYHPRIPHHEPRHRRRTGAARISGRIARRSDLCRRRRAVAAGQSVRQSVSPRSERVLILAPRGRDAMVAKEILRDARLHADICLDIPELLGEIGGGADVAVVTEKSTRNGDIRQLAAWVVAQPPWSDFPFILLTEHGGGLERNPAAAQLVEALGNVTFLERPFHPTTLVSVVQTGLRGRDRQYECRRLNEELESRVAERTTELATANRQLIDQIRDRESVKSTLRQMQRLEAVGQLTSGVAHDFNNLLTVILGNLGFVEKGLDAAGLDGKLSQRLGYMRSAAERGAKLTDQLLSFSRRQRLEPKSLDLNETVVGMRDLLQSTMGGTTRIETRLQRSLWSAMVDPTQLELAVLNLAINAQDAMQVGGSLTVATENVMLGPPLCPEEPAAGEYVCVGVSDTGTGMNEEVRAKVFEPFFTTKEIGKGSGLGLSQVLGFAKQSGGGVRIQSRLGEGTSVHIYLPKAEAEVEAARTKPTAPARPAAGAFRGAMILLVDDDNKVREVTRAMLHDNGHRVLEAGSGGAALDILEREPGVELLILDFAMPGMNGAEVARLVHAQRPHLPVLFVTGFVDRGALAGVDESQIIAKPFLPDELAEKVRTRARL